MSFTLNNLCSDQKLAAFGSFSIFCLSVTGYPRLIHCRKQPPGYQEVASQDEDREVLSPEAVSDLSTDTHHMGNKCPVLQGLSSCSKYTD